MLHTMLPCNLTLSQLFLCTADLQRATNISIGFDGTTKYDKHWLVLQIHACVDGVPTMYLGGMLRLYEGNAEATADAVMSCLRRFNIQGSEFGFAVVDSANTNVGLTGTVGAQQCDVILERVFLMFESDCSLEKSIQGCRKRII